MWQSVITFCLLASLSRVRATCTYPYVAVGERCLFFGTMADLQHSEARQVCHSMGGELAAVLTATQLKDIVDFIYDHGYDGQNFWLDGTDSAAEGEWQTSAGLPLPLGTPFWATSYSYKEPNNQGNEDCLHISAERSYYMNDKSCFHVNSPLCEENRVSVARNVTAPKSCPMPYVELSGLCLAFITWADQSWAEARQTCHGLSGELAALTDIEQLRAVYLYLHQESIAHNSLARSTSSRREARYTWRWPAACLREQQTTACISRLWLATTSLTGITHCGCAKYSLLTTRSRTLDLKSVGAEGAQCRPKTFTWVLVLWVGRIGMPDYGTGLRMVSTKAYRSHCRPKRLCLTVTMENSQSTYGAIVALHEAGDTISDIAQQLRIHRNIVTRWIRQHEDTSYVEDMRRIGRPRCTSHNDDQAIANANADAPTKPAVAIHLVLRLQC
ncbi:uncharacterized protein LOC119594828 [Penaeus monodon]|uniref:uncharacterized protein LOC119594828 n=1 Tax=Penaeus monodon TaxID=6687 RepID=UPI0018A6EB2B|nr:uncharacterized protein LOC119594828 [Penaeus monodon]